MNKARHHLILLIALLGCFSFSLYAKGPLKPKWLRSTPVASNNTYVFIPISVTANNLTEGRNTAIQQLTIDRNLLNTLRVQTDIKTISNTQLKDSTDGFSETTEFNMLSVTTFSGEAFNLRAETVDYYYDSEAQTYSVLFRVALSEAPVFDRINVSSEYGFSAGWRSLVVPGWGQIFKGSPIKGGVLLGGTALFTGCIIFSETSRSNYITQTKQTHDVNLIRQYSASAQNMATFRNVCIAGAAAVYLYNIVDALAARGAKRVIFLDKNANNHITLSPAPNNLGGISIFTSLSF